MIAESRGRERRFVDTNLFVYAHDESAGHKRETARGLIEGLWESREGCASVQVLQELFVKLTRKVPKPLPARAPRETSPPWWRTSRCGRYIRRARGTCSPP